MIENEKLSRAESSGNFCLERPDSPPLDATQRVGVDWVLAHKNALIADPMGSGKTAMALVAANTMMANRILVVCPAIVKENWLREFDRFYIRGAEDVEIVYGTKHKITCNRIILNYDLLYREPILAQLNEMEFDLLVLDEIHYLKSGVSKRTQAALSQAGVQYSAKRVIGLSGTPLTARPRELYPPLAALCPQAIQPHLDYYEFSARFCAGYRDRFGWNDKGSSHLKELNFRLRANFMLRRPPELFRTTEPKLIVRSVNLKNHKAYLELENTLLADPEYSALLRDIDDVPMKKHEKDNSLLGDASAARKKLAELKMPAVIDFIKDTLDAGDKLVVFAHHHITLDRIQQSFKHALRIDGNTAPKARMAAIDKFTNKPEANLIAGNIQAMGTGLDGLQYAANICLFAEVTWLPGEIDQAVARLERRGQKKQVYAYFLTVKDSIDEIVMSSLTQKRNTMKEILK